jgi:hypothetical protein
MGLMHHRLACGGTIETPSVGSSIRPLGFGTGVSLPQLTVRGVKEVEAHPLSSTPAARIQVHLVTGVFAVPSARAGPGDHLAGREAELAGQPVEVVAPARAERGVTPDAEDHLVERERTPDLLDVAHRLIGRVRPAARS